MFKGIKKVKDECPICEKRRNLVYGRRTEVVKIRGAEIPVKANVYHCAEGGHYFYEPKDEEYKYQTAYREFRKRKGMLQPEDIKQLRVNYGLSQRAFSKLLGCSSITIQRYESGALQDDVHNNLLIVLSDRYSFRQYFNKKKSSLTEKITRTIEKSLWKIDEKEKQLEFDFFFKHVRLEGTEVVMGKKASKDPIRVFVDIFARHEAEHKYSSAAIIVATARSTGRRPKKKPAAKNCDFSINAKGELALAA